VSNAPDSNRTFEIRAPSKDGQVYPEAMDGEKGPSPRTRTGRSRLEHRHGWLDAVWQGVGWQDADKILFLTGKLSYDKVF